MLHWDGRPRKGRAYKASLPAVSPQLDRPKLPTPEPLGAEGAVAAVERKVLDHSEARCGDGATASANRKPLRVPPSLATSSALATRWKGYRPGCATFAARRGAQMYQVVALHRVASPWSHYGVLLLLECAGQGS